MYCRGKLTWLEDRSVPWSGDKLAVCVWCGETPWWPGFDRNHVRGIMDSIGNFLEPGDKVAVCWDKAGDGAPFVRVGTVKCFFRERIVVEFPSGNGSWGTPVGEAEDEFLSDELVKVHFPG